MDDQPLQHLRAAGRQAWAGALCVCACAHAAATGMPAAYKQQRAGAARMAAQHAGGRHASRGRRVAPVPLHRSQRSFRLDHCFLTRCVHRYRAPRTNSLFYVLDGLFPRTLRTSWPSGANSAVFHSSAARRPTSAKRRQISMHRHLCWVEGWRGGLGRWVGDSVAGRRGEWRGGEGGWVGQGSRRKHGPQTPEHVGAGSLH